MSSRCVVRVTRDDDEDIGDNCGKSGSQAQEEAKADGGPQPPTRTGGAFQPPAQEEERKRFQLVDGAYRIVFNKNSNNTENKPAASNGTTQLPSNQFHNRTNIRDRSLDNLYGDADFSQPS